MIEAPLGAAAFNNEFGRPSICGFFRTLTTSVQRAEQADPEVRGYHKPIMIAGGLGAIRPMHTFKRNLQAGDAIVVLGGPAMLIGLGGGAASSVASGTSSADLDFASVQRDNAEMQRRCQEVINQCWALGDNNPIISIHDVGAGGLSNALPEIVEGCTFLSVCMCVELFFFFWQVLRATSVLSLTSVPSLRMTPRFRLSRFGATKPK